MRALNLSLSLGLRLNWAQLPPLSKLQSLQTDSGSTNNQTSNNISQINIHKNKHIRQAYLKKKKKIIYLKTWSTQFLHNSSSLPVLFKRKYRRWKILFFLHSLKNIVFFSHLKKKKASKPILINNAGLLSRKKKKNRSK